MKQPLLDACVATGGRYFDSGIIEMAFGFLSLAGRQDLMSQFIKRTHHHWLSIAHSKDVATIVKTIFASFPELDSGTLDGILSMVKSPEISLEEKMEILKLGKSLIKISLRHLHLTPEDVPGQLNVQELVKAYDIKL
jgi:hypothetical protein